MPSPTFLCAGTDETLDFSLWTNGTGTSGTGTLTSATDQFHSGSRSLKSVVATTNDDTFAGTPDGTCADAGTRLSFWVRFSSVTPSQTAGFLDITTAGGAADCIGLGLTTAGKLMFGAANAGGGNVGTSTGSTVFSANTWYRLALSWVITSNASWTVKAYINGALELTVTNALGANLKTGTSVAFFGVESLNDIVSGGGTPVITMWFDGIYVDNGTDNADPDTSGRNVLDVTAKRPFANGTTNGFTTQIGSGGSGYGSGHAPQVNEQPLSQTNGWSILVAGSAITEEYNIEGVSVGDIDLTGAVIVGVMGWIVAKSSLSETDQIVVDGTATNIAATSTPTAFMKVSPNPTTYPAGTGSDIGMKTNTTAATASLYEAGVLVAFLPTVARAVSAGLLSLAGKALTLATAVVVASGALLFAGQAPTLAIGGGGNTAISVGVGKLVVAGQAPTVSAPATVGIPVGVMTWAGQTTSVGTGIQADVGALIFQGRYPSIAFLTPPAGALIFAGQTPTLRLTTALSAGSLVLAGQVPTVQAGANVNLAVPVGALTLAGQAPALQFAFTLPVSAGALLLAGQAPVPQFTFTIPVSAGSLLLTGQAPSLGGAISALPAAGVLVFSGYAPALHEDFTIAPSSGVLTLAGQAPNPQFAFVLAVPVGLLTITGQVPAPVLTGAISPSTGLLTMTGRVPALQFAFVIGVPSGALLATGQAPVSSVAVFLAPSVGALTFAGDVPQLGVAVSVTSGVLTLAGRAPVLPLTVAMGSGALVLAGQPPTPVGSGAISPSAGSILWAGMTPTLRFDLVAPVASGVLSLAGHAPTLQSDFVLPVPTGSWVWRGSLPSAAQFLATPDVDWICAIPVDDWTCRIS